MCLNPITIKDTNGIRHVPCGTCMDCLRRRQQEWSIRTLFEWEHTVSKLCFKPYFITLTYDDDHLTIVDGVPVLNYKDWHNCLHYLIVRKGFRKEDYRFLLCGEYGSLRHRPHYHSLFFCRDEKMVHDLRTYWQRRFCPKSLGLINSGRYALGEIGVYIKPITVDGESAIKVAKYVSKYCAKGSFDFTKSKEHKDFYRKYPSRVFTSRGYGMQRLEMYKKQISSIKIRKTIGKFYNPLYLRAVERLLRVPMGVDMRDPNKTYYAQLPKIYWERIFPKRVFEMFRPTLDGVEKHCYVARETPSLYFRVNLKTALGYLREQDDIVRDSCFLRSLGINETDIPASKKALDYYLAKDNDDRQRLLSQAERFERDRSYFYMSQIDFQ